MSATPTTLTLRSSTVRLDPAADTTPLLDFIPPDVPARDLFSWVRRGGGLVGWGRAATVSVSGSARFAEALAWWQRLCARAGIEDRVRVPGSGPIAFGSFCYSPASPAGGTLVVPTTVVGRRDGVTWVTRIELGPVLPDATSSAATPGGGQPGDPADPVSLTTYPARLDPGPSGAVRYSDGAMSGPAYEAAVAAAVLRIAAGDVEKVVLARDLLVTDSAPFDAALILRRLAAAYDRTWVFSVDGQLGATPEMLVRLERGLVTSRVLAGTIRRTGDDAADLALAGSLARSSKDLEEHEYAVRSVADALAPHCTSMNVPEEPTVLHLPNVMHLATDVTGSLRDGASSLELAAALHPSAAVCGTPKQAADRVIGELEGMDRGRYAGPVGWVDAAGDGEWGIALRTATLDPADPRRLRIFAGCGIVAGSDPADELAEADAKLIPMRTALEG